MACIVKNPIVIVRRTSEKINSFTMDPGLEPVEPDCH